MVRKGGLPPKQSTVSPSIPAPVSTPTPAYGPKSAPGSPSSAPGSTPASSSCSKGPCKEILEIMDTSVNPCTDFYQFSCGKWKSKYPRPVRSEHWTNFVRLDRNNLNIIRDVLEGKGKNKFSAKWMKKVRKYYNQCKLRDKEDIDTATSFVKHLIKDVNVNIKRDKNRLTETLASVFTNFGGNVFFKLYIGINDNNSSQHIIKIDPPTFTFPNRENYVPANKGRSITISSLA